MTLPIPDEALDDRLGFTGTSGAGKTYSAGTVVERVLERRGRVVITTRWECGGGCASSPTA